MDNFGAKLIGLMARNTAYPGGGARTEHFNTKDIIWTTKKYLLKNTANTN